MSEAKFFSSPVPTASLHGALFRAGRGGDPTSLLCKALAKAVDSAGGTAQATDRGEIVPPLDPLVLKQIRPANIHHASCLVAKVNATVGLGFKSDEVAKVMDPLTRHTFQDLLTQMAYDREETGVGYIEAVYGSASEAPILYEWVPAEDASIFVESSSDYHYKVGSRRFPRFGDRAAFAKRMAKAVDTGDGEVVTTSEIIQFNIPNNYSRYFGAPDWAPALAKIEMVAAQDQYWYDFFQNYGSLSKLVSIIGGKVSPATWEDLKKAFAGNISTDGGNKSALVNLEDPAMKTSVLDLSHDPFTSTAIEADRNMALDICAAHRTPPELVPAIPSAKNAGSNKGVTREVVDLFQAQVVGCRQRGIVSVLESTIGKFVKIAPITKVKQEISGVTQTMVEETESGWTFKRLRDEMEFDMTPQLGGPTDARNSTQDTTNANQQTMG